MQNGRTAIKSTEQLYVDGIFDASFFFVGLLSLVESSFRGAENEQGLVAWELACHRYPAVGHGMPTSSSLLFFLPLILLCKRRESSRLVMS